MLLSFPARNAGFLLKCKPLMVAELALGKRNRIMPFLAKIILFLKREGNISNPFPQGESTCEIIIILLV